MPNNSIEYFFNFLRNMKYYFCPCCVNKNSIYYLKRYVQFEAAPEPEEIIFENLEVKPSSRIMRTILIHIISIFIICFSLGIIIALNRLQEMVDKKNESKHLIYLYLISFIISEILERFDNLLEFVLKKLTKKECQFSKTDEYLSRSVKLSLYSFLNEAILPLISELVFDKSDGYEILISNMLMIFLNNAFLTPIRWTINLEYLKKIYKKHTIEGKIKRNDKGEIVEQNKEEIGKTQKELNKIYELSKC